MKLFRKTISFGLICLILSACSDNGVIVSANFANTQDIEQGTKVYFGNKIIGTVSDTSRTDFGSVVELSLDTQMSKKVNSKAAVVVNRLRTGGPLEIHNPPGSITEPLQAGQTVEALDSMLQLVGWGLSGTVTAGVQSISEFKNYLGSDEFRREKDQLSTAIDESLSAARQSFKEAEQAIQDVSKDINLSETELAALIDELGQEMAPMVTELTKGGTQLMLELERFSNNLEQQTVLDRQRGQAFLDSLTQALQSLNQSIDDGVDQALDESVSE